MSLKNPQRPGTGPQRNDGRLQCQGREIGRVPGLRTVFEGAIFPV